MVSLLICDLFSLHLALIRLCIVVVFKPVAPHFSGIHMQNVFFMNRELPFVDLNINLIAMLMFLMYALHRILSLIHPL